ncbi:MAG: hypothetical protein Q4Q18_00315 [Methanobrevibacter sp.]|nr:hypothetical protein [Methanobrevibacter sp.]
MSKEWDDIKVNRRKGDDVRFESSTIQSIYDGIEFLRDEATQILRDIDTSAIRENIDEMELREFGEDTLDQFSDIADDLSNFKNEIIDSDEVPEFVKDYSKNAKIALGREDVYIRRAKRKLERLEGKKLSDVYKTNIRVIELSDKAIALNDLNHEPYYLKGVALTNLKRYDESIEEFINSLALKEDFTDARLGIANANRLNGDFEDAINVYVSVLKIDENSHEALKGMAYSYYDLKEYRDANNFFEKANSVKALDGDDRKIWDECLENLD